jgi:hypothetical protein
MFENAVRVEFLKKTKKWLTEKNSHGNFSENYIIFHLDEQLCSPRPLWAAVEATKFVFVTMPHKGAGLRTLRTVIP